MPSPEVVVVGGGLAGCAAAIELAQSGSSVTILERDRGPQDRFCGEFLSPDGVLSLQDLGVLPDVLACDPPEISGWSIDTNTRQLSGRFAAPGLGVSRLVLDETLRRRAERVGVELVRGARVRSVKRESGEFRVEMTREGEVEVRRARFVLVATGRGARVQGLPEDQDTSLDWNRFVGVKLRLFGTLPGVVRLFPLGGAYAGASPVEGNRASTCLLAKKSEWEEAGKDPRALVRRLAARRPAWSKLLDSFDVEEAECRVVARMSYARRAPDSPGGIVRCGDAAGLTAPLLGEGMAMALESGRLVARVVRTSKSADEATRNYRRAWRGRFRQRLAWSSPLQRLLLANRGSDLVVNVLTRIPRVADQIVAATRSRELMERVAASSASRLQSLRP